MKNKVNIFIANGIRIIIVLAILAGILSWNMTTIFMASLALALTFLPTILTKRWNMYLPESLQVIMIVFIFLSNYLGELNDFYYKFPWWDDMLHSMSGVVLAIIGFLLVDSLNRYDMKNVVFQLSPFFVAFFAFVFAIACGAVWEIFEYSMDTFFGTNMQKYMIDPQTAVNMGFGVNWQGPGLNDTMHDLILDTIGAFIVGIYAFIRLNREKKRNRNEQDDNTEILGIKENTEKTDNLNTDIK